MTVTVEPGVVLDQLNAWLKPHGLWFPVDVSTSAQATLGRHGRQQFVRLALDRLRQHGAQRARDRRDPVRRHRGALRPRARRWTAAPPRVAELLRRLRAIGERERDEIERSVPKVLRRVGGYNIDVFHPQSERPYTADGSVNYAHLLVGSEGTLAWSRELTLKLAPLPAHRDARRRQFPDVVQGDGERAAPGRPRALGGRARRPHDDRPRARQPGVPRRRSTAR